MVRCDFEKGFQRTLLVGREGVTKKSTISTVYAIDNLTIIQLAMYVSCIYSVC